MSALVAGPHQQHLGDDEKSGSSGGGGGGGHHHHHHLLHHHDTMIETSTIPAAIEVLKLLGHVMGMWSRHRDVLQSLAYGGDIKEEEARVVDRMGAELRDLSEALRSSSSEREDDDDDEGSLSVVSEHMVLWC